MGTNMKLENLTSIFLVREHIMRFINYWGHILAPREKNQVYFLLCGHQEQKAYPL